MEIEISAELVCGQCLMKPPPYQQAIAPFRYQHTISWLITGLKFHHQFKNARLLAQLLVDQLPGNTAYPDFIVPVPLHVKRLRQRGFNQTEEIASIIAAQLKIPLRLDLCQRVKFSPPQSELTAKARYKNIRNAFKAKSLADNPHIAIFDDVMTTGATVTELSKTLKKAGAKQIDIWVCARA
jgi:ComF family protein